MNPADKEALREELRAQASAVQQHGEQLTSISGALQEMSDRHTRGMTAVQGQLRRLSDPGVGHASHASSAPRNPSDARLPPPEHYSGAPHSCRAFLVQCELAFDLQPSAFPTEKSRVA